MSKFERLSLIVQIALVFAAIGAFIAAAIYACIANKQLSTMNTTLHEIKKQTTASQQSAGAAQKAAEVAEQTLTANTRPWISVNMNIVGGIKFDEKGANISVKFTTKNVGNSPAIGIRIDAQAMLSELGLEKDIIPIQNNMLAGLAHRVRPSRAGTLATIVSGYSLFPGDEFVKSITFGMDREYIDRQMAEAAKRFGKLDYVHDFMFPIIIGYASYYGSAFDKSLHKTGFVGQISIIDPQHPASICLINVKNSDTPSNLIRVTPHYFAD